MSGSQIRCRAETIRDYPSFCFILVYAICFLGGSAAIDLRAKLLGPGSFMSAGWRYLFPLLFAIGIWRGLRSLARQLLTPAGMKADT
jgi:hypothetical protein